jgi:hypothetical protein
MYSYCYVCSFLCILSHCVVLCTVCVSICTVQLPPGVNTISINKYIIYVVLHIGQHMWKISMDRKIRVFCVITPMQTALTKVAINFSASIFSVIVL